MFLQLETCNLQRVSMTTQNGARRSCTWARRIISDYIFRVAILSNILKYYITWSFLANNNTDDSTYILSSIVSMTDDSIWLWEPEKAST